MTDFSPSGEESLSLRQSEVTLQRGGFIVWEARWEDVARVQVKNGVTVVRLRSGEEHRLDWASESITTAVRLFGRPDAKFWRRAKLRDGNWLLHLFLPLPVIIFWVWTEQQARPLEQRQIIFALAGFALAGWFFWEDVLRWTVQGYWTRVVDEPARVSEAMLFRSALVNSVRFAAAIAIPHRKEDSAQRSMLAFSILAATYFTVFAIVEGSFITGMISIGFVVRALSLALTVRRPRLQDVRQGWLELNRSEAHWVAPNGEKKLLDMREGVWHVERWITTEPDSKMRANSSSLRR